MKQLLTAVLLLLCLTPAAHAKRVLDIKVPDVQTFAGNELVLNGAGVRSKFIYDLYVIGLYTREPLTDADAIIAADEAMSLRIYIISDLITGERFAEYTHDGFVRSTHGNLAPIRKEVDTLVESFRSNLQKNDVYDLVYLPETGVVIYRNGKKEDVAEGLEFKQALFGIWLSDKPVNSHLRSELLGKE